MPHYTLLKRAAAFVAPVVAFIICYNAIPPPAPVATPYMVPAANNNAIPGCVYSALASIKPQLTGLDLVVELVPKINGEKIEGIMGVIVIEHGSKIPDPRTVKKGSNPTIEGILRACEPSNA